MLRRLMEKDAPLMLEWMQDNTINCFFRFDPKIVTMDTVLNFIQTHQNQNNNYNFAITDNYDEYMGTISLKDISVDNRHGEYAIALRKSAQGKGIAYRASMELLNFAFQDLMLNRVFLNVLSENIHAVTFYERLGFQYEGEFKKHLYLRGIYHNIKWYRMLSNEYKAILQKKE